MFSLRPQNRRRRSRQPSRWSLPAIPWAALGRWSLAAGSVAAVLLLIAWALNQPITSVAVAGRFERVAPLVHISTTGDRVQDRRLLEIGGKELFVKEIEEALLAGAIDLAVHSLKDMPTELPPGLTLAAIPEREDPRDALVSSLYASLDALPPGSVVGTSSLRREAMVRARCLEERLIRMNKQGDGFFWIGGPGEEALNASLGLEVG